MTHQHQHQHTHTHSNTHANTHTFHTNNTHTTHNAQTHNAKHGVIRNVFVCLCVVCVCCLCVLLVCVLFVCVVCVCCLCVLFVCVCVSFVCVVCVVCLCVCLSLCVRCVCVCWGTQKKRGKNAHVDSDTPPCVHSKRPRVCRHHTHMCFNMCAWCWYTRGRFESTHGCRGSPSVLLTKKSSRRVLTWPQTEVQQRTPWILHIFKFENRSRTTCPRFLQSFALPGKAVQFQQS